MQGVCQGLPCKQQSQPLQGWCPAGVQVTFLWPDKQTVRQVCRNGSRPQIRVQRLARCVADLCRCPVPFLFCTLLHPIFARNKVSMRHTTAMHEPLRSGIKP